MTDVSRSRNEQFVEEFGIGWPCGYAAPLETLARFGVYDPARRSKPDAPAFEVTPAVYLIGEDGRVLWHDGHGRFNHKDAAEWAAELDKAIQENLQ